MDWGLWVGIAGLVVAVAGVWIAYAQRNPKTLDYSVLTNLPILSSKTESFKDKLRLEYEGFTLHDPRLIVVRIANTGKRAVLSDDYVEPLTIDVENARPSIMTIAGTSVENAITDADINIRMTEQGEMGERELKPRLLNPGDWFDIQLLVEGNPGEIAVKSRFADQRRSMRDFDRRGPRILTSLAWFALVFVVAILIVSLTPLHLSPGLATLLLPGFVIGLSFAAVETLYENFSQPWKKRH